MVETIELVGFLSLAFAASAGLAYVLTGRRKTPSAMPTIGSNLRLRGTGGMYRAKLLGYGERTWRISGPLSRNNYVPLRIDDPLTVEAPVENGVLIFRTVIEGRDDEQHEFLLTAPDDIKVTDRRSEKRRPADIPVLVEGDQGKVVDMTSLGLRLLTNRSCHVGERVRLELADSMVYGWVLDFWPTRSSEPYRESVRIRLEEVFSLPIK